MDCQADCCLKLFEAVPKGPDGLGAQNRKTDHWSGRDMDHRSRSTSRARHGGSTRLTHSDGLGDWVMAPAYLG